MFTTLARCLMLVCLGFALGEVASAQSMQSVPDRMDRQMQDDFDKLDRQMEFWAIDGMLSRIGDRWFPVSGCEELTDRSREDVAEFRTFAALGPDDQPVDLACLLEDAGHSIKAAAVLTMKGMRDPRIFIRIKTTDGAQIVLENQGFIGGPARWEDPDTGELTLNRISTYYRVWRWEDGAAYGYNTRNMMEAMRLDSKIIAAVLAVTPEAPLNLAFE